MRIKNFKIYSKPLRGFLNLPPLKKSTTENKLWWKLVFGIISKHRLFWKFKNFMKNKSNCYIIYLKNLKKMKTPWLDWKNWKENPQLVLIIIKIITIKNETKFSWQFYCSSNLSNFFYFPLKFLIDLHAQNSFIYKIKKFKPIAN